MRGISLGKCVRCGKSGLFTKVNQNGLCRDCEHTLSYEAREAELNFKISEKEKELNKKIADIESKLRDKEGEYNTLLEKAKREAVDSKKHELEEIKYDIAKNNALLEPLREEKASLDEEVNGNNKKLTSLVKSIEKANTLYKSLRYSIKNYRADSNDGAAPSINEDLIVNADDFLSATVELKLHYMDLKQLKSKFNQNKSVIKNTLKEYKKRYTTKANQAIYQLMVIALDAELQNILYNISYGKVDKAINNVKTMTAKYQKIATDGNQNIAPTITRFIGEIEYLYIEAVKIEYEYFVQKERIKEEQRALREQMRQEAAERKALERERKKIEVEENKYKAEIESILEKIAEADANTDTSLLQSRLDELNEQLVNVEHKKEEILKLEHGTAGYVYIISNLGSFGDETFKIGMTRRLEPMERISELSGASVPFPFDVHSFIFSDNAVKLEGDLHKMLHTRRVNKVNLRKEFFKIGIEELEDMVFSIQPTAEFNKTLLAEQYNQSLSTNEIPDNIEFLLSSDEGDDVDDDEAEEEIV
jgi:hypothetical protein